MVEFTEDSFCRMTESGTMCCEQPESIIKVRDSRELVDEFVSV
jgi:hypothetical protein